MSLQAILLLLSLGLSVTLPSDKIVYIAPPEAEIQGGGVLQVEDKDAPQRLLGALAGQLKLDIQLVQKIIDCESGGYPDARNINTNGTTDYGLLQVNEVHKPAMEKLGLDIENSKDNLIYGLLLLSQEGTKHWKSSSKCWGKSK